MIAHIVPGLDVGGAERLLQSLVVAAPAQHHVYVLKNEIGSIGRELVDAGVAVSVLGAGSLTRLPVVLWSLRREFAAHQPDLIQGWLYHGNAAASLCAPSAVPIVYGIHAVNYIPQPGQIGLRASMMLSRKLAKRAAAIVYCAAAARLSHEITGYPTEKGIVIENGVDCARFYPDPTAKASLCTEFGLSADALLLGYAGRFTRFKDLPNLARTFAIIHKQRPEARLLAYGSGIDANNSALTALLAAEGVGDATLCLGVRTDTPRLMAGIDTLLLSSSDSEALPMAVLEAMSCGTPVAVTCVGELPGLLKNIVDVAPTKAPQALADLTLKLCNPQTSEALRPLLRTRILGSYDLSASRAAYNRLWKEIAGGNKWVP